MKIKKTKEMDKLAITIFQTKRTLSKRGFFLLLYT